MRIGGGREGGEGKFMAVAEDEMESQKKMDGWIDGNTEK
jgi:hypothetical protein